MQPTKTGIDLRQATLLTLLTEKQRLFDKIRYCDHTADDLHNYTEVCRELHRRDYTETKQ